MSKSIKNQVSGSSGNGALEKKADKPTVTSYLAAWTLVVAIATPLGYLSGRGYHDGWYEYFNLDPEMFSVDTAGVLHLAAVAWINLMGVVLQGLWATIKEHWFVLVLYLVFCVLLWNTLNKGVDYLRARAKGRETKEPPKKKPAVEWVLRVVGEPVLGMSLSIGGAGMAVLLFVSLLALFMQPFVWVGAHHAKEQVEGGFKDVPVIALKAADGKMANYHLIGCGPQFCGVWGKDHATMVPLSDIQWGESAPPNEKRFR